MKEKEIIAVREGDYYFKANDGKKIHMTDLVPELCIKNALSFVGYCSIDNKYDLYSLPKYYPKNKCCIENIEEIRKTIRKICNVIEKLAESHDFYEAEKLFSPYDFFRRKSRVNLMELAEYIIEDYIQNGIYVRDDTEYRKNGSGRTSWSKTISKIKPVIQNGNVIYTSLINKKHISDNSCELSVLHAAIVNQCIEYYGNLIYPGLDYAETDELPNNDLSVYIPLINQYSTMLFREREINLLKALEAWIRATNFYKPLPGTTCFYKVWEWVNDYVWGNIDPENIKSLNPDYYINNSQYKGTGDAVPDTIRTCLHKMCVRIFEEILSMTRQNSAGILDVWQGILTQSAAKFAEKTCASACEDRF